MRRALARHPLCRYRTAAVDYRHCFILNHLTLSICGVAELRIMFDRTSVCRTDPLLLPLGCGSCQVHGSMTVWGHHE